MRVLFLNQYFPPDPAPTGILLAEVAQTLTARGAAIDFVAARQDYRGGSKQRGRMLRELAALARMFFDGLRRPRPDVIFSASSPPCLLVVATLLARWHRARSVHWVMDVYPEIAVALGEIRPGLFSRMIESVMGWCYRRTNLVVALDEDMAERLRRYRVEPRISRPWVSRAMLEPASETSPESPWTWIYSGNLGRAHEWETLLSAQANLETRGVPARLVFQGGGPSWIAAQRKARELGLRACVWRDYVPEPELRAALLRAHCCVVTQRPEVRGLLWPSKLGLVLSLPRRILFVGPPGGAIARELRNFRETAVFAPGAAEEISQWIERQLLESSSLVPADRVDAAVERERSLAEWWKWMAQWS